MDKINLENIGKYLICVNALGFLVAWLDFKMNAKSEKGQKAFILTDFLTVTGGCIGTFLVFLFFDRKLTKENMTSRVIAVTLSLIESVMVLAVYSPYKVTLDDVKANMFVMNKYLVYYLLAVNVITFIVFGIDKAKAKAEKERIKIVTLLGLSFIGGSIGGLAAMYLFKHKTQKPYFKIGMPLILIAQIFVLGYIRGLGLI